MSALPHRVLVTDLDRTFSTLDLALDEEALAAAQALRDGGVHIVLATGRGHGILHDHPLLARAFDGFVLESGAIWGRPGAWRPTAADVTAVHALADEIESQGIDVHRRVASFSVASIASDTLRAAVSAPGCSFHPNVDRIDVTPRGVDKAAGLRTLLAHEGHVPARVVAIGDGANDVPLLAASDRAVAVANASPEARAVAHETLALPASQGFAAFVRTRLLGPESDAVWA